VKLRPTRRLVAVSAVVAGAVAIGSTALAGHLTADVKSYTGCLAPGDGVIIKVKEGNAPKSACIGGQTQVHLSGGDITRVAVTGALTGGGDNGEVTIGLKPEFTLPTGCAAGRVAEWTGSAWVCGVDNDTTYTNGTGLALDGTTFSVAPDYRVKNTPDCSSGQFATGFDSSGDIQCAAAPSSGIQVWQKTARETDLPKGEGVDVMIMPLAAGTYLVMATATVADDGGTIKGDEEVSVRCFLRNGAFAALPVPDSLVDIGEEVGDDGPAASAVVHGAVSLASADSVRFTCISSHGDSEPDEVSAATMTAIKVGTLSTP
jgi:hypothetical protein